MDKKIVSLSCLTVLFLVLSGFSSAAVLSGGDHEEEKEVGQVPNEDIISSRPAAEMKRSYDDSRVLLESEENELDSSDFVLKSDKSWSNATGNNPIMNMYGSMGSAIGYGDITGDGMTEIITGSNDFNSDLTDPKDQRALRVWNYADETGELELMAESVSEELNSISSVATGPTGTGYILTGGQDESEPPRSDLRLWEYEEGSISLLDTEQWIDDGYNNTIDEVAVRDIDSDDNLEVVTGGLSRTDSSDDDKTKAQITVWTIEDNSSLSLSVKEEWAEAEQTGVGTVRIDDLESDGSYQIITGGHTEGEHAEVRVWEWNGGEIILADSAVWTEGRADVLDVDTADLVGDGKPEIVTGGGNEQAEPMGTGVEVAVLSYGEEGLDILARGRYFVNPEDVHGENFANSVNVVDGNLDGDLEIVVGGTTEGPHPGGSTFWGIMMVCSYSEGQLTKGAEHYWLEDDQTAVNDQVVTDFIGDSHPEIVQIGYNALMEDIDQEHHARIWAWNYMAEADTSTLTIEANEGGTTDPAPGSYTYTTGDNPTVEAIPDENWVFSEWTGDVPPGEEEEKVLTLTMDQNKSLTANFGKKSYFEVSVSDHDETVMEGEQVKVNYTVENTGMEEDTQQINLTVDGQLEDTEELNLGGGEVYDGEFTWQTEVGDAGDHDLGLASYDDNEEFPVWVLEEGIFNVDIIDYDEEVMEGEEVVVEYRVTNTGDVEDTQEIEFTVDGQLEDTEELTLESDEVYDGEFIWQSEEGDLGDHDLGVSGNDDGDEVNVTVTEIEGVYFDVKIVDPAEGSKHEKEEAVMVNYTVTNIGETGGTQTIEFKVDGVVEDSEEVNLASDRDHRGEFIWQPNDVGEFVLAVASEDDEDDVTVNFEELEYYELIFHIEGEGNVYLNPDQETYEEGTEVMLEAVPFQGWEFIEWTGDYEGDEEEITITMDEDKEITAQFLQQGFFEVEIISPKEGEEFEKGEEIVVNYEVENTGDMEEEQNIEFLVEGEIIDTEEDLRLGPNETEDGQFIWNAGEEGDIELAVRSVDDGETVESTSLVAISVEDTLSYWWIIPVILIAVGLIAAALLIKRKGGKEEKNLGPRNR
ncbi:MAG: CARDB domain-containing protein [Candidatus Thermoplasmatota archaeon]